MKVESTVKPVEKFKIENIKNGKCTVYFFENINEKERQRENEKTEIIYEYDMYLINIYCRNNLQIDIEKNYQKWIEMARNQEYEHLAKEVREKRNKLLEETDKEMCIDRLNFKFPENLTMTNIISSLKDFFDGFANISKSSIAKYRQELRDITKQEGFPYKVVWPTKDKED